MGGPSVEMTTTQRAWQVMVVPACTDCTWIALSIIIHWSMLDQQLLFPQQEVERAVHHHLQVLLLPILASFTAQCATYG